MPSYGDGFGIAFLEALACGISVIGTKVDGGSHEASLDGQLCNLVDPKVPEELVKAITCVLCDGSSGQRNNSVIVLMLRISGQGSPNG
jgi:glycosyltransferase involved in cell wall biosynthesis